MYENIVSALRTCVDKEKGCADCPYYHKCMNTSGKHAAMVDAADAIEELQKQVEDYECRLEISPEAEYAIDKHCDNIISRMDKLIKGLDDKPRWIPVTERLPEKYEPVLVYSLSGLMVDAYIGKYDGKDYFGMNTYRVTHWMPLPESPKEET